MSHSENFIYLARIAAEEFIHEERPDETTLERLVGSAPRWVEDMVRGAQWGTPGDAWRSKAIRAVLRA
ncbi:MAG TPA: hypothetical protein VH247_14550, partial [Thermoleophilaceae bacterium]|nr:hypothetical protein [Thermoleophilaceae bacterium]